ncbi:hypothetical protein MN1_150 [Thermus phage MN1]|nr:hypothetical protein MN1_150 [Thermus phage MN1]
MKDLPKAVLDLLAEVVPHLLRAARWEDPEGVADDINIAIVLHWEDVPPVRAALENIRDHIRGRAPLDLHRAKGAMEYVRDRKEEIRADDYPRLLQAIAREIRPLQWFAGAFESRPILERDVNAAVATLGRFFEDCRGDDAELALAVKERIADVLWAAQPNTPLFYLEEALREGRFALKEFWGVSP